MNLACKPEVISLPTINPRAPGAPKGPLAGPFATSFLTLQSELMWTPSFEKPGLELGGWRL
jgi:hypothetical protein